MKKIDINLFKALIYIYKYISNKMTNKAKGDA